MRARAATAGIAIAMTACVLGACGSSNNTSSDKTTFTKNPSGELRAWGFNSPDEVATSRIDYAKRQLKNVSIKMDETSFDAQKFTTRVASGSIPDVVQMDAKLVATYAAQKLIIPLDKCFSAHGVNPKSAYYPSVNGDVTYQGHIWAVPQFYQPPAIILNKRVLSEDGVQASEINTSKPAVLLAAIKKMYKSNNGKPSRLGFDPVASGNTALWILAYGGQLVDSSGKPTLDDPANVKGLQVLKQITDAQGGYAKLKSFSDTFDTFGAKNQFVKDQVGAQVDAQWYVNVLTPYVNKVDIAAVPFYNSSGKPFTVTSGTAFVIPAGAKNKDAACAWAIDLTSLPAWEAAGAARAKTIAKTPGAMNTGLFTGSPQADQTLRSKFVKSSGNAGFDQTINTYYQIVGSGKSWGASPAGQQIDTELQNVFSSVLLGQKQPMPALKAAQQSAMQAYKKK